MAPDEKKKENEKEEHKGKLMRKDGLESARFMSERLGKNVLRDDPAGRALTLGGAQKGCGSARSGPAVRGWATYAGVESEGDSPVGKLGERIAALFL